jgi:hypothetical protein
MAAMLVRSGCYIGSRDTSQLAQILWRPGPGSLEVQVMRAGESLGNHLLDVRHNVGVKLGDDVRVTKTRPGVGIENHSFATLAVDQQKGFSTVAKPLQLAMLRQPSHAHPVGDGVVLGKLAGAGARGGISIEPIDLRSGQTQCTANGVVAFRHADIHDHVG